MVKGIEPWCFGMEYSFSATTPLELYIHTYVYIHMYIYIYIDIQLVISKLRCWLRPRQAGSKNTSKVPEILHRFQKSKTLNSTMVHTSLPLLHAPGELNSQNLAGMAWAFSTLEPWTDICCWCFISRCTLADLFRQCHVAFVDM